MLDFRLTQANMSQSNGSCVEQERRQLESADEPASSSPLGPDKRADVSLTPGG